MPDILLIHVGRKRFSARSAPVSHGPNSEMGEKGSRLRGATCRGKFAVIIEIELEIVIKIEMR